MKRLMSLMPLMAGAILCTAHSLDLDPKDYTTGELQMPDGTVVEYKAYEGLCYVENVEDPTYQTLNLYIPVKKAEGRVPILFRNNVGGYREAQAKGPNATDATGRALQEGYVVCIPGCRGAGSNVDQNGMTVYTGKAPYGLLDLKAAIRYLRHNKDRVEGDVELIFSDGTSAGGAMSSLLGATGNAEVYAPYLKAMGAADERDDIYAAICYCPITDLNHADMEYEWLYACTNDGVRHLDDAQKQISDELAALCPAYINSLGLKSMHDGTPITADNYREYLATFIAASAHRALQEGCQIPDSIGITLYSSGGPQGMMPGVAQQGRVQPRAGGLREGMRTPPNGGPQGGFQPMRQIGMMMGGRQSDFVKGVDLDLYLSYVATSTALKTPPSFDTWGVLVDRSSPENSVFGNAQNEPANFTDFSLQRRLKDNKASLSDEMVKRVMMYNPMDFIGANNSTIAPKWYIRHGAKDRDTSFLVPVNLATKLQNNGYAVDFLLPWNRPHSGDYNLDDLFRWISENVKGND